MNFRLVVLLWLALFTPTLSRHPIQHVVVLMMENRSFDHLLGFLKLDNPEIDGLSGNEFNYVNVSDPSSEQVSVGKNGYDEGPDDPNHDFWSTAEQIYGFRKPNDQSSTPKMNGFAQNANEAHHNLSNPFAMFTKASDSAPILNLLASEFAVFDRWFCSVPGPTDPNRAFAMSGTSVGQTSNFNGTLWGQQSYFDFLREQGHSFSGYYEHNLWALFYFNDTVNNPDNNKRMKPLVEFFIDLESGELAEFTWLQPSSTAATTPASWQHPDASIREGERLIKAVYEALVVSEFWENTVLLITYDEHGGFFDHVAPPDQGVPSPDGVKDKEGFNFDRLGVRIPTIAVSPWINKGTVVHEATGPTPTSQYDATSVMATTNKLLGIDDHLTERAAWAGTFEDIFLNRDSPRDDCPKWLPDLPEWSEEDLLRERALPINDNLKTEVAYYCKFNKHGEDCGKNIKTVGDASDFIDAEMEIFLFNLAQ